MKSDILTLKEVAKYLKLNTITTYRLAQQGKLPAVKIGGQWRVRLSSLNKWLAKKEPVKRISRYKYSRGS
ncbi:MAG: helix-turn-helix domain-containing protein [Candidatus Omnitrophica bacterium]|nr:helix-turn-helix domain-containing protein [Candidatus Omnitrophota bacterium]